LFSPRHCEERSDINFVIASDSEAIQLAVQERSGLLRHVVPRNDER